MAFLGSKTGSDGIPKMMFTATQDWTPLATYEAMVYVIGCGGSGARIGNNATTHGASGGGAGGCAVSRLMLNKDSVYNIVVGDAGITSIGTGASHGEAGDVVSFACSAESISMAGAGGGAGQCTTSGSSKGIGGAGSGGNIANIKGGDSKATPNSNATGGGAVGLFQEGLPGANIADNADYEENSVADGGNLHGSMGGNSYGETDMDYTYHSSVDNIPIAMSPFADITATISGTNNRTTGSTFSLDTFSANMQTFSTGGNDYHRGSTYKQMYPSGPFAGGNGLVNMDYGGGSGREFCMAGFGTLGGGGGGCINQAGASQREAMGGRGGRGAVLIFPLSIA